MNRLFPALSLALLALLRPLGPSEDRGDGRPLPCGILPVPELPPGRPPGALLPDLPLQESKDDPGKQTEKEWVDARWNLTDVGPFMTSALKLPDGKILLRAISVKTEDGGFVFDPDTCALRAAWTGKFLAFGPARYGLIEKPKIAGELVWASADGPSWDGRVAYHGLHLHGARVVFSYDVDGTNVQDTARREGAGFVRTIELGPHDQERTLTFKMVGGTGSTRLSGDGRESSRDERLVWS
ncbi:MAG TPA: DUF6797 domain-containing protein, partial [Planctomycetota bacterium]|nr:DUF6797 domain-containing protein [Planctomycetota bacterium]